ncbi:MAG: S-layer homology domain-containing protein [Deltaproteobacteria bacterium]
MKKLFILIISLIYIFTCAIVPVQASPPDFAGGINDENTYEEVVFLSGEPVKFSSQGGKFTVKETEKDTMKTVSYTIKLTSVTAGITGTLDRSFKLVTTSQPDTVRGQTIATSEIKSFKESITIGSDTFTLKKNSGYQFSKSDIIDNRPASDFYSGTLTARKYYEINDGEGTAIVDINGGIVGYDNFWGNTETQILNYSIAVDRTVDDEEISWTGLVKALVTDSMTKRLEYTQTQADYSSFNGGYMRITDHSMASAYEYDLPVFTGNIPSTSSRNNSEIHLSRELMPRVERLVVPKFRDTSGHWAQEAIEKLYGLEVYEGNSAFFLPSIPMTRLDFIHGVVKACNIRAGQDATTQKKSSKKTPAEVSPYTDLPATDANYAYVKDAVAKGIAQSMSPTYFGASEGVTRAQAVAILIKALGFDSKAPSPPFQTSFADDADIPAWARDSVYVAREIGLISGDSNYFRPNKVMTRAEASVMLENFLVFLQKDLQEDYRDKIVLYN